MKGSGANRAPIALLSFRHEGSRQSRGRHWRRQWDRPRAVPAVCGGRRESRCGGRHRTRSGAPVAAEIGGWDIIANVSSESDVQMLVDEVLKRYGQIDLFCSNAGMGVEGDCCTPDRDWLRSWEVNVMGHVYAARAVLPGMLARHEGYLLQTVSAAGLLTHARLRALRCHQTCRAGTGRVAQHHLRRSGHQGFRAVPHGSEDPHAGARRVRRWHLPAGRRASLPTKSPKP